MVLELIKSFRSNMQGNGQYDGIKLNSFAVNNIVMQGFD